MAVVVHVQSGTGKALGEALTGPCCDILGVAAVFRGQQGRRKLRTPQPDLHILAP